MAYTDRQRSGHIRELQEMLSDLSLTDSRLPHLVPDGIYGRETAYAVKAYQQTRGLKPTGEANAATWDALSREHYDKFQNHTRRLNAFPSDRDIISEGDEGLEVYIVQAILKELARIFDNLADITVTGRYDEPTKDAVRSFRQLSGNNEIDDRVDRDTWNRLTALAEHLMQNE